MESHTKLRAGGSEEAGPSTRKCIPRTENKLKLPVHETRGVSVKPIPVADRPSSAPDRHKSRRSDDHDQKSSLLKRTPSAPQSTNRTTLDSHRVIVQGGRHSSLAPVSRGNVTESQRTLIDTNISYSRVPSSIDWEGEPEPEEWQRHVKTPDPEEEEIVIVDQLSPRKKTIGKRFRDLTRKFFRRNSLSTKPSMLAPAPEPPQPSPSSANVRAHALDGGTTVDTMINFIPPRRHIRHPNKMDRDPQFSLNGKHWFRTPREEIESIHAFPIKPPGPKAVRSSSNCSLGSEMSIVTLKEPGLSTAFPSLVSVVSQPPPKPKKKSTATSSRLAQSITPDGKVRLLVLSKKPASLVRLPSTKKPKGKCKQRPKQEAVSRTEVPVPDPVPAAPPPKCVHKPKKCSHKPKVEAVPDEQPVPATKPQPGPSSAAGSSSSKSKKPDQMLDPALVTDPQPGPSSAAGNSKCKPKKPSEETKLKKDYSYFIPDPIPPFVPPSKRSVERTSKQKNE